MIFDGFGHVDLYTAVVSEKNFRFLLGPWSLVVGPWRLILSFFCFFIFVGFLFLLLLFVVVFGH